MPFGRAALWLSLTVSVIRDCLGSMSNPFPSTEHDISVHHLGKIEKKKFSACSDSIRKQNWWPVGKLKSDFSLLLSFFHEPQNGSGKL